MPASSSTKDRVLLVLAIAGGLVSITKLWDWGSSLFHRDLQATVSFGPLFTPPSVAAVLDSLASTLPYQRLDSVGIPGFRVSRLISAARNAPVNGYYDVEVANVGSSTLNDVTLTLQAAREAALLRPGESQPVDTFISGRLVVGTMGPHSTARATLYGIVPGNEYEAQHIEVTHHDGIGSVNVLRPVGGIGRFADTIASPFYIPAAMSLIATIVWLVSTVSAERQGRTTNATDKTSDEADV